MTKQERDDLRRHATHYTQPHSSRVSLPILGTQVLELLDAYDLLQLYQANKCPQCNADNPTCKYCVTCGEVIAP